MVKHFGILISYWIYVVLNDIHIMPPAWNNGMLELWKIGKYLTGQNIKGNGILPNPELFKTSVDVFSIHDRCIS